MTTRKKTSKKPRSSKRVVALSPVIKRKRKVNGPDTGNPDKKTLTTVAKVLAVLREGWSVTRACHEAGISRQAYMNWRHRDPEFAKCADDAIESGTDKLEDEATRRAHDGVSKPVFYQGDVCGTVQEYSDQLMNLLLGARRPDKYRQKIQVDASIDGDALATAALEAKAKLEKMFKSKKS